MLFWFVIPFIVIFMWKTVLLFRCNTIRVLSVATRP